MCLLTTVVFGFRLHSFASFAKIFRKGQTPRKRTVAHLVFKTRDLAGTCFPCGHIASSATTVVFHSVGATGRAANRLLMS